ncbi:cellulosome enzyme [Antribacter soli]|uniref:cellulosome enzyme n=1 Tax=Antribacter soli TaxID=2910976 RepID=UPI001F40206C|nr:cellulosome enzyme [Antribacter soli]
MSGTNRFTYGSGWGTATGVGDLNQGTAHWSNTTGAVATFTFVGTRVTIMGVTDADQGISTYSVDGGAVVTKDDYAPTRTAQATLFDSGVLAAGTHTVTITATGTKNAASSARTVAIDSAIVTTTQTVDDSVVSGTNRFTYGSGWGTATGVGDLNQGTAHWSNTTGAVATFTFVGTRVTIMGVTDADQGISTYSVDGGAVVTKDDYAPTRTAQATLFDSGVLAAGTHTVTITATGTKNAASSARTVAIDSAIVTIPDLPALRVDLGASTGAFHGGAAGTLYGVYGDGLPSLNLIEGMGLRTVATKAQDGPQHPGADALEIVKPIADSSGGDTYIYMTDIYRGFPYQWPGSTPQARLDDYRAKVSAQVDQVLTLDPAYQERIVFVPFNEPEGNMFGTGTWSYNGISWLNNPTYFYQAWDEFYRLIKAKMPSARIAGPNTSVLYNQVQGFLSHTAQAGTVPEVMAWHELSAPATIRANVAKYRGWETTQFAGTAYAGTHLPINLDEYAYNYHTSVPGQMIQWVSAIEDSKVDADIAYWNIDGNLSDSAVQANRANGQWWLFNAYSDMTGDTVRVTPPSPGVSYTLQGVATLDTTRKDARLIFGGAAGGAHVQFDRVPSSFGGTVHAVVEEIPWTGQLGDSAQPRVLGELNAQVTGGSVSFDFGGTLPALNESSAYQIILTPGQNATSSRAITTSWQATYEAEAAAHTGTGWTRNGVEGSPSNVAKFFTSGGYDVGGLRTGSDVQLHFTVDVPQAGTYDLSVFANSLNTYSAVAEQGPTNVFLRVDGAAEQEIYLPLGYKWVVWDHSDAKVQLSAGRHTLTLAATSLDGTRTTKGDAIVDKLDLSLANPAAAVSTYEAEEATLSGATTDYTRTGVSGSGVARLVAGDSATFWVYSATDGPVTLTASTLGGGTAQLAVNGTNVKTVGGSTSATVFLTGGVNKIQVTGVSGALLLDRVRVAGAAGSPVQTSYEAESAQRAGSATLAGFSLASGDTAVSGIGGAPGNGNTLTFNVVAAATGTYALTIRYSNPEQAPATHYNVDPVARHADISVNGGAPDRVLFPMSFHANNFWDRTVLVQLQQGSNTIRFSAEEIPDFGGTTYISDRYPDDLLRSRWAPIIDKIGIAPFVVS